MTKDIPYNLLHQFIDTLPQKSKTTFGYWVALVLILIQPRMMAIAQCGNNCGSIQVAQIETCNGNISKIQAITNGTFVGWSGTNGSSATISSPNQSITEVQPLNLTSYTATARFTTDNLLPNGNFELGNQGFSNDYILHDTGTFKSDQYYITTNPRNQSSAFVPKKDHTSGNGNMMLADGSLDTASIDAVYRIRVQVEAGKPYNFSAWMANIHKEFLKPSPDSLLATPANFGFYIDSVTIGTLKLPMDTSWQTFGYSWTPSISKTITIEIKDLNTKKKGNDFVIDDISLTTVYTKQSSISVQPCNHKLVFSPDGDGNADTYFIEDSGNAKIFDLDGNLIRELQAPTHWDGLKNNGSPAGMGYYAIVIGSSKSVRVSLVR